MSFFEAIKVCFIKYVEFAGRAGRREYWYFFLFTLLVSWVIALISYSTLAHTAALTVIFFLPAMSSGVRRLHDINLSGWWWLVTLIPILGTGLWLYWMTREGDLEENRFGPPNLKTRSPAQPSNITMRENSSSPSSDRVTTYTIGRNQENHFLVDDSTVSGQHALLFSARASKLLLVDMASSNGTRIYSAEGLEKINQQVVSLTDTVYFGSYKCIIQDIISCSRP